MSSTISNTTRKRHMDLQPLATSHDSLNSHEGRASIPSSVDLTNTGALPSPSVLAAHAYFLERSPPIAQNENALLRRRSLIEAQKLPRRHSVAPSSDSLANKISSFKGLCQDKSLEVARQTAELEQEAKPEGPENAAGTDVKRNDLVKVTAVATAVRPRPVTPAVAEILSQVPFQYTHDRLKDWGNAYLGNTATADAFINAVSLRRPSLALVKEDSAEDRPQLTGMVTIRARVHPRATERKPFLIQRQFDIEELRASIPAIQRPAERITPSLRRSSRTRRSSAQQLPKGPRQGSLGKLGEDLAVLGKGIVPIHIEYALHYLPVLAALMLSGHVRRGDSIDLPVPHPEAWRDMMSYIYTGNGEITASVKENILYLAGNAG